MNIFAAQIAMEGMLEESYSHTELNGRFSPHKNFTESLEEWCEKNNADFRIWRLSTLRFFTLRAICPRTEPKKLVRYCLIRDQKILGLK